MLSKLYQKLNTQKDYDANLIIDFYLNILENVSWGFFLKQKIYTPALDHSNLGLA